MTADIKSPLLAANAAAPGFLARLILIWSALLLAAAAFDRPVAAWVAQRGVDHLLRGRSPLHHAAHFMRQPGTQNFAILAAIAATVLHRLRWRAGIFMVLAAIISGINSPLKWLVGRYRPFTYPHEHTSILQPFVFEPLRNGIPGLFKTTNLSFPSGHTCVAFATAFALAMLWPRWRWVFYAIAGMAALDRVLENAHYVSDVVGAAGLMAVLVHLLWMRGFASGETVPA